MFNFIKKHKTRSSKISPCATSSVGRNFVYNNEPILKSYFENIIVYRCVTLIARGVASIQLTLYQNMQDKAHEIMRHPLLDLLHHPNNKTSGAAFFEYLISHFLLFGNVYVHLSHAPPMLPTLELLPPEHVTILSNHGKLYGYVLEEEGREHTFYVDPKTGASDIMHIKTFHPKNMFYGLSPLNAAHLSILEHNSVSEHNLSILQNGGRPSGALIIKDGLSIGERNGLKENLEEAYEGSKNAGRIMILEGDMEWKDLGMSPRDLDFSNAKQLSGREIAQAFGVPPQLVGIPGDATFANYREARHHLWEDTILPLCELLLSELNQQLVPYFGKGLRLAYDKDKIPALSIRRESTWKNMIDAHFLTINEKRAALGYGPVEGGDRI